MTKSNALVYSRVRGRFHCGQRSVGRAVCSAYADICRGLVYFRRRQTGLMCSLCAVMANTVLALKGLHHGHVMAFITGSGCGAVIRPNVASSGRESRVERPSVSSGMSGPSGGSNHSGPFVGG